MVAVLLVMGFFFFVYFLFFVVIRRNPKVKVDDGVFAGDCKCLAVTQTSHQLLDEI